MPSPRAGRLWLLLFVSSSVGGGLAAAPHVANERRRVRGVRAAVPTARSAVPAETTATWKERKESEKAAATRLATAMESDEEMPASSLSMPVDKSTPMAQPAMRPAIVPSEAGGAAAIEALAQSATSNVMSDSPVESSDSTLITPRESAVRALEASAKAVPPTTRNDTTSSGDGIDGRAVGKYKKQPPNSPPRHLVTRMVHLTIRHGQRTPKYVLPNDNRKSWPEHLGPGMLTTSGARSMTMLGKTLRNRYVQKEHVLSPEYTRSEIYVRSTDIDRSLQSAESLLRGIYPSHVVALFPPIHTVSSDQDILLRGYDHCRKYHRFVAAALASKSLADEFSKDTPLFNKLSEATGVHVSPRNIKSVADTVLLIREFMAQENNEIDSASDPIGRLSANALKRLQEIHDRVNYVTKGTSGMGRLMVGNLLRDMLERMVAVVHGMTDSFGQGPPRLVIYSAHDTTLMGLLSALGVGDTVGLHMPPVGSHMEIELREDVAAQQTGANRFYVRVMYNEKLIRLGNCAEDCPIAAAAKFLDPMVPPSVAQWNKECDNGPLGSFLSDTETGLGGDDGLGVGSDNTANILPPREYLGLDSDEWSTMAILLACVLVLENVIFEVVVCRFFFDSASKSNLGRGRPSTQHQQGEPSTTGEGPRGGSLLKKSKHYYEAIAGFGDGSEVRGGDEKAAATICVCCGLSKRSLCCGLCSVVIMVLCLIFLIAFGAGWEDWPGLCFIIVSIISFEAAVIVGITVYLRCLTPTHDYDALPTRDLGDGEYYDDDGTLSDTL